jgi:DNA-binding NarL/FixJ family response regulator
MDVRMPDIDGLAVTRGIKVQHPGTSVIIFTMYENHDHLLEALRSGAAGYLLKGASRAEILTAVRQVLAGESLLHPELVLQMLHRLADTAEAPVRAERLTHREIAATLGLNASTVKSHGEQIIAKLGVSDRTQAAVRGIELGLVSATRE